MDILAIVAMGGLLGILWIIKKEVLFPPIIFVSVWLLSFLGIFMAGNMFYPVSELSYLIYIVGAVAFSFGGMSMLSLKNQNGMMTFQVRKRQDVKYVTSLLIDVILIILIIGLPFYWKEITADLGDMQLGLAFAELRRMDNSMSDEGHPFSFLRNFVIISQFIAMLAFYERAGSKFTQLRSIIAILLAILYGSLSGTKGNAINLLITLFFIYLIGGGRFSILKTLLLVSAILGFFSLGLIFVNFSYMDTDDVIGMLAEYIMNYWVGGLVAFNTIALNPDFIPSTQPVGRFFLETARSLGMSIDVPSIHAKFIMISQTMDSNTYTIYFTYYKDYGWIGTIFFMFIYGFLTTWFYLRAKQGNPIYRFLFAILCAGIVFSFNAEHFFLGLNFFIKSFLFFYFVYVIFPAFLNLFKYNSKRFYNTKEPA
jgi:oligosaccharide repeat unit polymerase